MNDWKECPNCGQCDPVAITELSKDPMLTDHHHYKVVCRCGQVTGYYAMMDLAEFTEFLKAEIEIG